MFDNIGVYNHSKVAGDLMPLNRYIWDIYDIEEDGEDAEPIFKKGDNIKSEYKSIAKRNNNIFKINYSIISTLEDEDDDNLLSYNITLPDEFIEDGKFDIWAKPYDGGKIECLLANKKGDNKDESKKFILSLETGEIVK